ncbi:Forkhead box protein N1 [Larimichthys crocea]|uniref:Uncharacterized protein n=1 Tax=Larimichthys crocea TaxID=215358 RepID=A0ACD3QLX6_LARCR|nr:Forkhead box protein N1 [Larimichthys crocea]
MSDSPPFCPSSSESQGSSPQADIHTCDPCGTSCQQMAESQESNTFNSRTAAVNRRHSVDGTISSGRRGTVDSDRFHPYRRPLRDDLQQCSSSYGCLQESSYPELPAVPVEPSCFLSQSYPSYSSPSSLQQASSRLYGNNDQSNSTKYSLSTQSHQESVTQSLFPKPIYSYSILIFLALKNSRTGSLPVSEIYSFMTEHFPFFKTAPDGWKNSVRHNLSLNKCFVKVENKNGNSSRKGCLWALNPAKVEKMQEELHKWRRKDPITVRRSMARPECLDRLLGDEPDKQRSLPLYTNNALLSRVSPIFSTTSSSRTPPQAQPPCVSIRHPEYASIQPQLPCYVPHAAAYPSMYSPCGQPTANGSLNSPIAGKIPSAYNGTTQADCSDGPRSMQEFLLEGDASYDVDTLNPSLTDLQLQGTTIYFHY